MGRRTSLSSQVRSHTLCSLSSPKFRWARPNTGRHYLGKPYLGRRPWSYHLIRLNSLKMTTMRTISDQNDLSCSEKVIAMTSVWNLETSVKSQEQGIDKRDETQEKA